MKVALAQTNPTVGDFKGNVLNILAALEKSKRLGAELVLFSEMALVGYPPEDFLLHREFIAQAEAALQSLLPATQGLAVVLGTIRQQGKELFNTAAVIENGKIKGYQDKALLPTYDIFDEKRYFTPCDYYSLFEIGGKKIAITICEDIWFHSGKLQVRYARDPVVEVSLLKPDIVLNLSASPYHFQKYPERQAVAKKAAQTIGRPLLFCNQVGGNDSLIFDGYSFVVDGQGKLVASLKGFEEDLAVIDTDHLTPIDEKKGGAISDLHQALVLGIRDYFHKSGFQKACLGLSGGIDSALTLCLGVEALGKDQVTAIYMPSRYSPAQSRQDAQELAQNLGVQFIEIPIESPFEAYLNLLKPHFDHKAPDVTEENIQARIRGMILMALSNKLGLIVLSTGNKSELAMGYSTLYGDLTGGLAVLSDVTKDKVYQLAHFINGQQPLIPLSTMVKAPSAELRPDQKDADTLPSYPIIDAVLEGYVEQNRSPAEIAEKHQLPLELVKNLVQKIHQSEYKRRQAPPGLRVTEKAFTVGRRFPIVQRFIH